MLSMIPMPVLYTITRKPSLIKRDHLNLPGSYILVMIRFARAELKVRMQEQ